MDRVFLGFPDDEKQEWEYQLFARDFLVSPQGQTPSQWLDDVGNAPAMFFLTFLRSQHCSKS